MKIEIKVIPNSKKNFVKKEFDIFKVYITAKPVDGKANQAVIGILSDYFNVKKRQIEITRGLKSRIKSITIYELH